MFESTYIPDGDLIVKESIRQLRRAMGAEEITKTALAPKLGVSRQTLSGRFSDGDMKLSEFVAASIAAGRKPSDLIATAEGKQS